MQVAGGSGWRVSIDAAETATGQPFRLVGVVFNLEGRTWVITYRGPRQLVAEHLDEFNKFLGSLRISPNLELTGWFRAEADESTQSHAGFDVLAAVFESENAAWILQAWLLETDHPGQREEELRQIIASIQPGEMSLHTTDGPQPVRLPWTWTLPAGWTEKPGPGGTILQTAGDVPLNWRIQKLARTEPFPISLLVRHWREVHRLPPLAEAELARSIHELTSPVGRAWIIRLAIPPSSGESPATMD